ncbi:MAG: PIG-L family deacetylase [Candidatus Kerfeldbacteria bacterium]|nr:PIG-L family deacetylase [Candidatus Kerfeldbacteria bacterium]
MKNGDQHLIGKHLLVCAAHPDDESFCASGTLMKNRRAGGTTTVVCATAGEKGMSHLRRPVTPAALKQIRIRELRGVCRYLGVRSLHVLNYPDGGLTKHLNGIAQKLLAVARKVKPDALVGFGPDGWTGHRDHATMFRAGRRVASRLKLPYFAFCIPPLVAADMKKWMLTRRRSPHYHRHVTNNLPTVRVAIRGADKIRALRFHASQLDGRHPFTGIPKHLAEATLRAEYFAEW